MSEPKAEPIGYCNEGSKYLCESWNTDWKHFFVDVCQHTGLTLAEAMQFHIVMSSLITRHAVSFLANNAAQGGAKEPWQE